MACTTLQGEKKKPQIFQSLEEAPCISSLLKRKGMFHKIRPCGRKLSFFVPSNGRVWLYILGQLSSNKFQKLTRPIKRGMKWWQHHTAVYSVPSICIWFGASLGGMGKKSNSVDKRCSITGTAYSATNLDHLIPLLDSGSLDQDPPSNIQQ